MTPLPEVAVLRPLERIELALERTFPYPLT